MSRATITTAATFTLASLLLLVSPNLLLAAEPDADLVEAIERLDAAEKRLNRAVELNDDAAALSPEIGEDFRKARATSDKVEGTAREWATIEKAATFPLEALGLIGGGLVGTGGLGVGLHLMRKAKKALLGPLAPVGATPNGNGTLHQLPTAERLDYTPTTPTGTYGAGASRTVGRPHPSGVGFEPTGGG